MKKILGFLSACAITVFAAGFACLNPMQTAAEDSTVYVSASGSDENAGTADAPFQTLDKALSVVENKGTVALVGTVAIDSWNAHGKTATVTGGTLDVTAMSAAVDIHDSITFQNMTWSVTSGASVYANGYKVTMGENVSWDNEITLFGGGNGTTVANTDLTVLSGTYVTIYGGTRGGYVTGNTNVCVGGSVNEGIDVLKGPDKYKVYAGGGYDKEIKGSANLTFGENANARYIYGGQYYESTIKGGVNVTITGGAVMSVYGGNKGNELKCDANVTITGGTFEQIFGGSEDGAVTGDVVLKILGGTITRRVYGGCYNNYSGGWKSSHSVSGKVTLEIGGDANITLKDSQSDKGIFAFSRYGSELEKDTQIIFTSESAYNAYKNKLGNDYSGASWNLSGANEYHYYTYEVNGNELVQTCVYDDHSGVATVSIDGDKCWYTGKAVEPASVDLGDTWEYTMPTISYANNVEVGSASAYVGMGDVKAETQFIIVDAPTILGGSVRTKDPTGLRFQSKVDSALVEAGAEFGTLLIPQGVLGENELTVDTTSVEKVPQTSWAEKSESDNDYEAGYHYFNAVLMNIPEEHFDKVIVARSYVYANGQYYYAEAKARSIMQVASYALQNNEEHEVLYHYIDKGLEGKEISVEGDTQVMEDLSISLSLVGAEGCVAKWSSSDEKILTVDNNGKVQALRAGTATVTAKIGNKKFTVDVTVISGWTGIF